jgi:hypothetical protein
MKRTLIATTAAVVTVLGFASASEAQVFIRAPFVRVAVGDGVAVRAPFVNLWVPPDAPYYGPGPVFGPRVVYMQPPGVVQQPQQQFQQQPQQPAQQFPPAPQPIVPQPPEPQPKPPIKDDAPPQPVQPVQAPTLEAFAKSFQPKAGTYEVTILNPVSKQPTPVRFILPDGAPRRTHVTRDSIEFVYGLRQWVRIEFDRDGVQVTAR